MLKFFSCGSKLGLKSSIGNSKWFFLIVLLEDGISGNGVMFCLQETFLLLILPVSCR